MVEISALSRARRAFRDTPRFHFVRDEPELADEYQYWVHSAPELGGLIGAYKNPNSVQPDTILIAEHGLVAVKSGIAQRIEFSEIESIRSPGAQDDNSDISLVLRSGIVVGLPVAGRDGRFRDVFSFVRFLARVLEDRS
jgi:DNA helicase HerA-like ATPase